MSYWYGFIAQFTILPFHQEYADSGKISISTRLQQRSFKVWSPIASWRIMHAPLQEPSQCGRALAQP